MDNQEISKSAMEAAAETIQVLKGTVESLQMNLDQERNAIDGLHLTIDSLEKENEKLQERVFQLEAEMNQPKVETPAEGIDIAKNLEKKLGFYYKDLKAVDGKNLTAEDSETLYNILDYTFKALRKAGLKF